MPLTELMNYFNDQLQVQAKLHELPRTGFYKANDVYWARFGNLTLGSELLEIRGAHGDSIAGHYANLLVRSNVGNLLNIDDIVQALEDTQQVIHLDRLVRTLHSLNYLQQFDGFKSLLALRVQPRHILSVADQHGKTFEKILSDCGLGPERVVLHTKLTDEKDLPHFRQALNNYRQRNYRIGVSLERWDEWELAQQLGIDLDYVFTNAQLTQAIGNAGGLDSASFIVRNLNSGHAETIPSAKLNNVVQGIAKAEPTAAASSYSVLDLQRLAS